MGLAHELTILVTLVVRRDLHRTSRGGIESHRGVVVWDELWLDNEAATARMMSNRRGQREGNEGEMMGVNVAEISTTDSSGEWRNGQSQRRGERKPLTLASVKFTGLAYFKTVLTEERVVDLD